MAGEEPRTLPDAEGRLLMLDVAATSGFRKAGSGLLVPAGMARHRDVWTRQEWRAMDAAAKAAHLHGVTLSLRCAQSGCRGLLARTEDEVGQAVLRCDCTDRLMARGL